MSSAQSEADPLLESISTVTESIRRSKSSKDTYTNLISNNGKVSTSPDQETNLLPGPIDTQGLMAPNMQTFTETGPSPQKNGATKAPRTLKRTVVIVLV